LCHGPIGIDLAGILIDHYIPLNLATLKKYCNCFAEISIYDISAEDVYRSTLWGGLQRNLRIMGTLTELYVNFKRSFRMNDLPQIVSNTALLSKELNLVQLANFLLEDVSENLEKELLKI